MPPATKFFYNNRGKAIVLAVMGKKPLREGVRLSAAHIDSPRLDLKPNPLYEDNALALFKTHYYGGIKKYQWTCIPLSLHGVIIKKDGESVKVNIGEDAGDPQFVVTDLLPHLAAEQMKRKLSEGVRGEELNVLVGSRPFCADEGSEKVKLNILQILFEKYGRDRGRFLKRRTRSRAGIPGARHRSGPQHDRCLRSRRPRLRVPRSGSDFRRQRPGLHARHLPYG